MNALNASDETVALSNISSMDNIFESGVSSAEANEDSSPMFTAPELFWCVGFSAMLSVAVFGNILVIWIVLAHPRMRSVTNFFLINLAFTDLTMALFNAAPNFAYMLQKDWILGSFLCMINNFVANFSVASSVFTMTAVSIDRYLAIVRPLQPRMTKGMARRAIAAIWVCSLILASPGLLFSKILTFASPNRKTNKSACIILWPDNKLPPESNLDFGYNICLLLVTYVTPMILMAWCYGSMSKELWGHRQIGEAPERQTNAILSKRKIVRMFIILVVHFGVCWAPYHIYFIYQYYSPDIVYIPWIRHLYFAFYWLAMSTTMINPIVYYYFNARFRNYIREVGLRCCFCWKSREPDGCPGFAEQTLPPAINSNNSVHKSGYPPRMQETPPVHNICHHSKINMASSCNSNGPTTTRLQYLQKENNLWHENRTSVKHCSTYC